MLRKEFILEKEVKSARAYVCGLGLYEMVLNAHKAGEEYLTPHFNAYDKWLQYQTYDVTNLLQQGVNRVNILLGDGLYKGRFGFDNGREVYGDRFTLLCEIVVTHIDGSITIINSDETWTAQKSKIIESSYGFDGGIGISGKTLW